MKVITNQGHVYDFDTKEDDYFTHGVVLKDNELLVKKWYLCVYSVCVCSNANIEDTGTLYEHVFDKKPSEEVISYYLKEYEQKDGRYKTVAELSQVYMLDEYYGD